MVVFPLLLLSPKSYLFYCTLILEGVKFFTDTYIDIYRNLLY